MSNNTGQLPNRNADEKKVLTDLSRREVLALTGTSLTAGLAGCPGDSGGLGTVTEPSSNTSTPTDTSTVTPTETPTPTPTPEATFNVSDLTPTDATVTQGDAVDVSATVTNTGNASGTQDIEFRVDGSVVDTQSLSLDAGGSASVSTTLDTSGLDPGGHTHAVASVDDERSGTLTIEDDALVGLTRHELSSNGLGNAQTDTPPFCPRLKTYDGSQYYAYWTHAGKLVVASRDLPKGEWTQNHTDIQIGARDGHWTPAVGVGPEGHVFICYNTRGSSPTWRRSENPADVTSFGPEQNGMTGQNESGANYPEFTRLDDGTLLFGYRQGGSGNGDWMLNRWNDDAEEWEPLQHPLILGEFEGDTYNAYPWNLVQSNDGMLHYFFCWRGTGGVQTNQQLSYARSPDGGETWIKSDGTEYDLPITKGSVEVADDISPDSNLSNQGWSSFHPETNEPHVAYYRDDEAGNTQIFHAYRSDGDWEIEATTDRGTNIDLGGPGVVASPIGRMGIVVGDDGDVHILARDFRRGSWPLLVEKLDGEWQMSVLYKRNLTWSDLHIDTERWRQDRVLSFVDHQQTIRNVPHSAEALVGITDVNPTTLDRTARTVDSWEADGEWTTYATTTPVTDSVTTESTSFEDTSAALAFTETTVPATPIYARATGEVTTENAEMRVKIQGGHGETLGDPAAGESGEEITTGWTQVPQAFRAGSANIQVRSSGGEDAPSPSEWSDYTIEAEFTVESESAGFIFRAQDGDNLYMWQVADESHVGENKLRAHIREGGSERIEEVPLGDAVDAVIGQSHTIRIEAFGNEITTYIDGTQVDQRTDDTHASGTIGVRTGGDGSWLLDSLTATAQGGDVLLDTSFEYDTPQYFSSGELVDNNRIRIAGISDLVEWSELEAPAAEVSDAILELGYVDPVGPGDDNPLVHMDTVDATGLQGEAPFTAESTSFVDTPTTLDIERASSGSLYGRVTARMDTVETDAASLDGLTWIWYPNDDPAWDVDEEGTEGVRYFRRTFSLDEIPEEARMLVNADNLATVWINGTEVGTSADGFTGELAYSWEYAPSIDVTDALETGENTIAMKVERFGYSAALIGELRLQSGDETRTIGTDSEWVASQEPADGWRTGDFDDSGWPNAQELGEYGMDPYGTNVTVSLADPTAVRIKLSADGEESTTDAATSHTHESVTTGWEPIPAEFDGGTATLQASNTRITVATLELAVRNDR